MYNKEELIEKAKKAITEHNLYFVEDIIAYLGISKSTFYVYFKEDSDESNLLKDLLHVNRVREKVKARKKWSDSKNPILQVAFYKLIATDEEAHRLNGSKQEVKQSVITQEEFDTSLLTDEELRQLANIRNRARISKT